MVAVDDLYALRVKFGRFKQEFAWHLGVFSAGLPIRTGHEQELLGSSHGHVHQAKFLAIKVRPHVGLEGVDGLLELRLGVGDLVFPSRQRCLVSAQRVRHVPGRNPTADAAFSLRWEVAVYQVGDCHRIPFQTLGRVHREDLHHTAFWLGGWHFESFALIGVVQPL